MKYGAAAAIVFVAMASTTACTNSSKPGPTATSSSSSQSSSASAPSGSPPRKDQSGKVLDFRLPADVATARSTGKTFKPAVTLHIVKFAATSDQTLLTFYLTSRHSTELTGEFLDWADMPAFAVPGSKTVYKVNTYKLNDAPKSSNDANYKCVCSTITDAGGPSDKVVYTAEYPALPSDTRAVTLIDPHFEKVNVRVSR